MATERGRFSWKSLFGENKEPWGASALRTKSNLKFKLILSGKTLNSHKDFITRLNQRVHLKEVNTEDECDFILGFCPIVSGARTDIEVAKKRLHNFSDTKPVVLVVLHHTFNTECVVPDSIKCVNRKNMIAVDCLFYEDTGLLQCLKNNDSLDKTSQYLKEYINCKNMERQKEGERSGPRNSTSCIEKEVTGLEGTNMKPDQTTNDSEESENSQPERNQQLNPEHIDTDNVEGMEQRNESQEKIMRQNLKTNKEPLTENTQTLQKKDKTLEEKEKQLSEVREELRKSSMTLEKNQTQLKDKEKQLESVVKEQETSTNKLTERDEQLQEKNRLLTENTQTLQEKDKTLEEKEKQLKQTRAELDKTMKALEDSQRDVEGKYTQLENLNKLLKEKETQLKNSSIKLETSTIKVDTLGQELQDKEKQLVSVKEELETSTNKLTERDEQFQEKNRLLTENTQTLQKKDKTLEEKEKQLSEVREELRKSNMMIEKYQTQLKDKDRQLVSVGKELETSTNKLYTLEQELQDMITVVKQQKSELAEKKQQLEEKDRLLAEIRQKLEMKDETLEHKGTHFFQSHSQLKKKVKCYEVIPAKLQAPCEQFTKELKKIRKSMEMSTEEKCKAILYYVPYVSRAGTDIESALQKLNSFGDKYIALVVLHHTSDRELITPDSSRTVTREKTFVVDCLFSEDEGLLSCPMNDEAIKKVAEWLRFVKNDKQEPKKKKKVKPVRKTKQ
ncbi:restin homolog isoform X3 [Tachysurus fulvidraco]|uniref:restin homolog isoform X3 n=1 Tax=Tachysurus fulvidraco TaxID=1234273 RepID=UPI001FEDFB65|nr:restin homolog isoform X3 [Tachysurus fulvidraco]